MMRHFIAFFCLLFVAIGMNVYAQDTFVLIGPSGVGKSAIINALIGEHVAKSGISFGEPITTDIGWYEHEGRLFLDTPAIELDEYDALLKAKCLGLALSKPGTYRIFFVFNPCKSRLEMRDKDLINFVVKHLPFDAHVNVIFNRLSPPMRAAIERNLPIIQEELPAKAKIILVDQLMSYDLAHDLCDENKFCLGLPDDVEDKILKGSVAQTFTTTAYRDGKLLLQ